ncbi:murein DD-endopeptidase MepM/ murein hydrolase activator NlpD [Algoriphagus sp. 4150]|uniref:peptidoglycan DD-metalloendopeptidase family protein n=1 Tax=Algoriphagus sp. 4150 TaxID=2817756 RepID=UPI00285C46C6|nr:peptidoglycan DD-metalloendopeptidase family protein [Algoriphagus sp. 4150]MDR7131067.1 murein DD-endopeptidase MepM/ murein hydrolase activator NlpD [Algoriphagus sp. 4150]
MRLFKSSSARTQYVNKLESSGISSNKIGEQWINSANEAILNAPQLEVPIAIQGSFISKTIAAEAWKIQLEQGASIDIIVHWQASDSSELIVDLLEGPDWKELKSYSAQNDSLKFEAGKTGYYVIRIQPELLGQGNFQLRINGTATYSVFPVEGKDSRAIQSVWGDVRDGGQRAHEGVDIFAARGTPVLAPVGGVVTAVRDRGLGGKQVWLRDSKRNWNLYFAHLDSQLVRNLQRVNLGDTLGLVGNTGNAITTAPHLHFGIYQSGAINPFPAIKNDFIAAPKLSDQQLPPVMKVNVSQANLRNGPSTKSVVISKLKVDMPVFIKAATADWFQIETIDGTIGFLYKNLLSPIDSTAMEEKSTYVLSNYSTFSTSDSLWVKLEQFSKIGTTEGGMAIIVDKDGNVLYLPSL